MKPQMSKTRARAVQLLYAWEVGGGGPVPTVSEGLVRLAEHPAAMIDQLAPAEEMAVAVVADVQGLDKLAAAAAENWRWERVGVLERSILRLGCWELKSEHAPPKVVIDESVQLAHLFAGPRAASFINGVLDRVARELGRL
jgi:N utilization substance protein B